MGRQQGLPPPSPPLGFWGAPGSPTASIRRGVCHLRPGQVSEGRRRGCPQEPRGWVGSLWSGGRTPGAAWLRRHKWVPQCHPPLAVCPVNALGGSEAISMPGASPRPSPGAPAWGVVERERVALTEDGSHGQGHRHHGPLGPNPLGPPQGEWEPGTAAPVSWLPLGRGWGP